MFWREVGKKKWNCLSCSHCKEWTSDVASLILHYVQFLKDLPWNNQDREPQTLQRKHKQPTSLNCTLRTADNTSTPNMKYHVLRNTGNLFRHYKASIEVLKLIHIWSTSDPHGSQRVKPPLQTFGFTTFKNVIYCMWNFLFVHKTSIIHFCNQFLTDSVER